MSHYERRLPIYMLVDCSCSMAGEPIEAVKHCLKSLLAELEFDSQTNEATWVSIVLFNSVARQVIQLSALHSITLPNYLDMSGVTALGEALEQLSDWIDTEVITGTSGDWKPTVFIFTDGGVNADWERKAIQFKASNRANMIICSAGACKESADLSILTADIVNLNASSARDLVQMITWD